MMHATEFHASLLADFLLACRRQWFHHAQASTESTDKSRLALIGTGAFQQLK